jgi:carboxypeptidase Taq
MNPINNIAALYKEYEAKMQKIADVKNAAAVLEWDQETYLPSRGAGIRGRQLATLAGIAHEWFADDSLGDLLKILTRSEGLTETQRKNVIRTQEDYEKNKKYTPAFVRELSLAASESYHAWMKAREENDFASFEKVLQKMVMLKRQEADMLGYESHPYNALLDEFEKGATVTMLDGVFDEVKKKLSLLLDQIRRAPQVNDSMLRGYFDKDKQWEFGVELLRAMGFDFTAGRQDISVHPFTTSFNSRDVRVTTRIDVNDFRNMTWSCIHEGGHALYEQGLPVEQYGLPCGEAASLAIHESQSRLWENNTGRSRPYWQCFYPGLQQRFPEQLDKINEEEFYHAINKVQPSFIRTEADELTYHFHIMIRYELEKKLIGGELSTRDLRDAWNEMYRVYLNIHVPDDRQGVLQDVHWSHGSFGYFPTYSLGSFYAAQFFHTARSAIPALEEKIASGELNVLLQWLRRNIHCRGRMFYADELCEKVTGERLNFQYFLDYATKKFGEIYGLPIEK